MISSLRECPLSRALGLFSTRHIPLVDESAEWFSSATAKSAKGANENKIFPLIIDTHVHKSVVTL